MGAAAFPHLGVLVKMLPIGHLGSSVGDDLLDAAAEALGNLGAGFGETHGLLWDDFAAGLLALLFEQNPCLSSTVVEVCVMLRTTASAELKSFLAQRFAAVVPQGAFL